MHTEGTQIRCTEGGILEVCPKYFRNVWRKCFHTIEVRLCMGCVLPRLNTDVNIKIFSYTYSVYLFN